MQRLRRVRIKDRHYLVKYRQERSPHHALKSKGKLTPMHLIRETKTEKIQKILGITIGTYPVNCYTRNLMSCQEIVENIKRICNISISRQIIWKILKRYEGILRHHSESMKIRAITGRIDYSKTSKHIDYKNRKIDYKKIQQKRRDGVLESETKIIELELKQLKKLKRFAKDNKLTISDAIKKKYYPKSTFRKFIARLPKRYR